MARPWTGIQRLPKPVEIETAKGLLVDIFYRPRMKLWVVWTFAPPSAKGGSLREIVLLGGFRDRAKARFAADTALVAAQHNSSVMPMMAELLVDSDGEFTSVLHAISHVADFSPWLCPHIRHHNVLPPLCAADLGRLSNQIDRYTQSIQDWRFMWVKTPGNIPCPSLIRVRSNQAAAAVVLEDGTFSGETVRFWLDSKEHQIPCRPTSMAENPLSEPVLENLTAVMAYCDKLLRERYGADSNAPELIAILREESMRESTRQIAQAFGTAHFVGEA